MVIKKHVSHVKCSQVVSSAVSLSIGPIFSYTYLRLPDVEKTMSQSKSIDFGHLGVRNMVHFERCTVIVGLDTHGLIDYWFFLKKKEKTYSRDHGVYGGAVENTIVPTCSKQISDEKKQ